MLGTHRHFLDFEILETGNPKTLVFVDSSDYMESPDRPLLETTMPGYNKYFLSNVIPNQVNTFNSSTLGFNKVLNQECLQDLPDGAWTFKFKVCPYDYVYIVKKHMRVTLLMQKLGELYVKINLSDDYIKNDRSIQNDLIYIHILIEGAKASVNIDAKEAFENYQLANKMVDSLLTKFCKNC